jgi:hypothetical protein
MRTGSLMFPANCRTVVRLMEAWYDAQVSLSTLAGRHFVYIMEQGQQAAPPPPSTCGGVRVSYPPHEPAPYAAAVWVHSCSARYYQQPRSLCWLWLFHAAKRPSLLLAHLHTCTDHKRGSLLAIIQQLLCHGPCTKAALHPPCTLAHRDHQRGPGAI